VQFRGFVPECAKFQLLAAADLFALPSLHEAFGLVYLEAMHCGLPVIAARPGGHEDGRTGFLVPPDDLDGLASALARLVEDPALRARISAHNLTVAHRFTVRTTAARYESLFARISCAPAAVFVPA
jgi:glycosyltransferase involved in cell wall biosynthesis